MRDSLQRLSHLWKARLSKKIAVAIFVSIVAVETVILIPSVYRREQELLDRLEDISSAKFTGICLAQPDLVADRERLVSLFESLPEMDDDTYILGGAIYDRDGELVTKFGEPPEIGASDVESMPMPMRDRLSQLDRRTYRYDVVWDTKETLSSYTVVIRHDARHVRDEYIAFIGRIAGLVLIISIVVTVSTAIMLDRLLIAPLLGLRDDLLTAGTVFRHSDGERPKAHFASVAVRRDDELGDIATAFATMVERISNGIDDLQTAQIQLVHSEKMSSLGHLVAGIAHEINNPINFIYGNIGYVNDSVSDLLAAIEYYRGSRETKVACPPEHTKAGGQTQALTDNTQVKESAPDLEALEFILEDLPNVCNSMRLGAERVRDIVLSLRNFARLDEADLKVVDLCDGIDNALLLLRYRLEASSDRPAIAVERDGDKLPAVECYAGQLNQALLALLLNAIEAVEATATEPDSANNLARIAIHTRHIDDDRIAIAISDTGVGIAPDIRPKIFDPFFTTKPVGQNKGLGLSIAERILTVQHGGTIAIDSEPGAGTTVTLTLPVRHTLDREKRTADRQTQIDIALDRSHPS